MIIKYLLSFWAGFTVCALLAYLFAYSGVSVPLADASNTQTTQAPSDWVAEKDIYLTKNQVIINIEGASLSRYAPTGSMKPLFDEGANGIRIKPKTEEDINIGDIITFKQDNLLIVHRVIEKGQDEKGTYYITKGDNNLITDGKIRYKDIKYLTIGVIW